MDADGAAASAPAAPAHGAPGAHCGAAATAAGATGTEATGVTANGAAATGAAAAGSGAGAASAADATRAAIARAIAEPRTPRRALWLQEGGMARKSPRTTGAISTSTCAARLAPADLGPMRPGATEARARAPPASHFARGDHGIRLAPS